MKYTFVENGGKKKVMDKVELKKFHYFLILDHSDSVSLLVSAAFFSCPLYACLTELIRFYFKQSSCLHSSRNGLCFTRAEKMQLKRLLCRHTFGLIGDVD